MTHGFVTHGGAQLVALCGLAALVPAAQQASAQQAPAVAAPALAAPAVADTSVPLGALATGGRARLVRGSNGSWGVAVDGAGSASAGTRTPVQLELFADGAPRRLVAGYSAVRRTAAGAEGEAMVRVPGSAELRVRDVWRVEGPALRLRRTVTVTRGGPGAFMSGFTLAPNARVSRPDVQLFAPGMIYGTTAHLTDSAIGGARAYRAGTGDVWIREDRLPAPMVGVRFRDGTSLTVLDPAPDGATTRADAEDTSATRPLVDARFRFGAVGTRIAGDSVAAGFWYPGTEGEVTYKGNTYPGGQVHRWRRRYHPLAAGHVQRYAVDVRFGAKETFPQFYTGAWRWAWRTLAPEVTPHPVGAARRAMVDVLASRVETANGRSGLAQWVSAVAGAPDRGDRRATIGFVGKNLEAAEFMLAESLRDSTARGDTLRARATRVFDTFARLPVSPPEGEGFHLDTGQPVVFTDHEHVIYLRSFADDMKATLRAIRRERAAGHTHDDWLRWTQRFGDWLLAQQRPDGGLPRSWSRGGLVRDSSAQSTFNAVPFFVLLGEATGDRRYLDAAVRAGEFAWGAGQADGIFVGGTIDNPDVIDKEAGTLSTEAYLALLGATGDRRWLERAKAAANFAETWIYLWDVPAAVGADPAAQGWKPGVPTTGAQLISTGHSLTDVYMSFDVDEYARLAKLTGDSHYLDVARVLLHDTKHMLALPGRTYDLRAPGWQQEHWSFAPRRGNGLHRGWLPWVATSQLNGIVGLEEFDPTLYAQLAESTPHGPPSAGAPSTRDGRASRPFTNPIVVTRNTPDPWLIQHGGQYYLTFTSGKTIEVWRSPTITGLDAGEKRGVWTAPDSGPNCCQVWSPQIRNVRGKWYIYYTASSGHNDEHRMFVLESATGDPLGPYREKARLAAPNPDTWGIFGDVLEHEGKLYALWSGWERDRAQFPQHTYIAPMSNAWTIGGPRVRISSPTEPWEQTVKPIQEGPMVLRNGPRLFVVYSADASWTSAYKLGLLAHTGGSVLDPKNWTKKPEPVFSGVPGAYGPGEASFVKSPDGREDWMIYHATADTSDGWGNRKARIQRFTWNTDGTPNFGAPVPPGVLLAPPSGEAAVARPQPARAAATSGAARAGAAP